MMKTSLKLALLAIAAFAVIGCNQGFNEGEAQKQIDIEKKVNAEALKNNPPKPGEGPGS